MKKLLLSICMLFAFVGLYAQDDDSSSAFDAGSIYANAQSDLSAIFADETVFNFTVGGGYFIIDNLMVGATYSYFDSGFFSDDFFSLNGRYYVFNNIFGSVEHTFNNGGNTALSAGINLFFNDSVSLEPRFIFPLNDGADPALNVSFGLFF